MRLSTAGRYALRGMVDLAQHAGEGPVLRQEIADRQEISGHYLAHLFIKLKQAKLVDSVLGPGGGYILAQKATEISAGDVLRAVGKPLEPVDCGNNGPGTACQRMQGCSAHLLWNRLGEAVAEVLDSVSLAELCESAQQPYAGGKETDV